MAHQPTPDPPAPTPSAVVWINGRDATVAEIEADGHVWTCEISRGSWSERPYLAQVARIIGDRQRVVILGPTSVRSALEREYVARFRRRNRLVDVEPAGAISRDELLVRLRTLASAILPGAL
jgi:hypothetical protein